MARFRCRACGQEGAFVYDPKRHECPCCGSRAVQFALGAEEMPDQIVDEILKIVDGAEPLDRDQEED
jgi:hypothetical protein